MTREEAITALGDRNNLLWGMSKEEQKYYSEALDIAVSALSENMGEWIHVSKRLPEVNQNVLATTKWGEVTIAERLNIGPDDWFIQEGNANAYTEDIVAWQPLPEPYKAESEDAE